MQEIEIDSEFKAAIPALWPEEREQLERNILDHGCRDPLVTWQGVILDGHNRYEICQRHGIQFEVWELDLANREAALDWIDANQLGRRNLTADAFKLLLGRRYNRTKKAQGGRADRDLSGDQIDPPKTAQSLAKEYGLGEATVKRAGKFAEEVEQTPELKEAVEQRKPVTQAKREMRENKREERRKENTEKAQSNTDLASLVESDQCPRFATIVADPPWDWGDEGDVNQLGRAKPDYGTMSLDDLLNLPVDKLADEDCHLYLWITNRSLPKGFQIMERWGFRYITALTWVKPHYGMGNYFRGQTEHVLFGVRGSQMLKVKDQGTVIHADRGEGHSGKPSEFYDLVERCSPGPYLEMFARQTRDGWSRWGEDGYSD